MKPLARSLDQIKSNYDVVIVGSGYGGGVSALRLALAGRRVCVLERGREFLPGDFPISFPDMRRELQVSGGKIRMGTPASLFDFRVGKDIHVFMGCGLGGGSLINAGVALRPDRRVFEDPVWPQQIAQDGFLDIGYSRATEWLQPAQVSSPKKFKKYKALEQASKVFNKKPVTAPLTIALEDRVNSAGICQSACTLCGDCCGGCNVGAKNTIAATYLTVAAAHGAEIFTETLVRHVEKTKGGWRVIFRESRTKGAGVEDESHVITADMVILAAGTLGSTEILLRSREHGLALSDTLGQGFSANGDIIAFGYDADIPIHAVGIGHPPKAELEPVGTAVTGQLELEDANQLNHGMIMQEGSLPSALAPLLPVFFVPGGRLLGAAKSLIQGVYKGPISRTHTFFVVSHDQAAGQIVLKDDYPVIDWPDVAKQDVYRRVDAALEKAVNANGAVYVKNPLSETMMGSSPVTAHPLGGCGMGADRLRGVVNHKSQVFDGADIRENTSIHEGLYVCDGAIMPRSLGANPLFTITAMAERAMIHLVEDYGWQANPESR